MMPFTTRVTPLARSVSRAGEPTSSSSASAPSSDARSIWNANS
jgi:hypothetical protein